MLYRTALDLVQNLKTWKLGWCLRIDLCPILSWILWFQSFIIHSVMTGFANLALNSPASTIRPFFEFAIDRSIRN